MMKSVVLTLIICFLMMIGGYSQSAETNNNRPEAPTVDQKNIVTVNHIDLYPNPVKDYLNIKIENSTLENVEFELYNIIGNSMDFSVEQGESNNYKIDIKDFYPGYYLLVIKDPLKRFNKSFKFQKK